MIRKHICQFIITICSAVCMQSAIAQQYPITVGAYQANDTLQKTVFLAQAGIAEAVDDFGFETRLRGRNIDSWSCVLSRADTVLFSAKNIQGFLFPVTLLKQVKNNDGLLHIRFYDIALKTDTLPLQAAKRELRYFIE